VSVLLKRGIVHTIAELCGMFPTCALRTRPVVMRRSVYSVVGCVVLRGAGPRRMWQSLQLGAHRNM
jgi:hypothetical protein